MARATIKYGNVYLLARRSSSSRSCLVSTILYGLFRGKLMPSRQQYNRVGDKRHIIRYRIYGEKYLVLVVLAETANPTPLEANGFPTVIWYTPLLLKASDTEPARTPMPNSKLNVLNGP